MVSADGALREGCIGDFPLTRPAWPAIIVNENDFHYRFIRKETPAIADRSLPDPMRLHRPLPLSMRFASRRKASDARSVARATPLRRSPRETLRFAIAIAALVSFPVAGFLRLTDGLTSIHYVVLAILAVGLFALASAIPDASTTER
jgi:hypothetical protein